MATPSAEYSTKAPADTTSDLASTAPGQLRVIKRNGKVVPYSDDKISVAISKAFLAVEGGNASASSRIHDLVIDLTEQVSATFQRRMPSGGTIHIEEIQDQVELALMRNGEHKVARDYVLYREARANQRAKSHTQDGAPQISLNVTTLSGAIEPLDLDRIKTLVSEACENLDDVTPSAIIDEAVKNLYDGIPEAEISTSLVMTARSLVEKDPNYSFVTARLLLDQLRSEALTRLDIAEKATQSEMADYYPEALEAFIKLGVEKDLIDPNLEQYDMEMLGAALLPERDNQFTYLGLQTLYDRYFLHTEEVRIELPQVFFMRVAMGLAAQEADREERAIEFYQLLSSFDYMSSTPTLFNAGTLRPQLSSCYLTTVPDDLMGIYGAIQDNAMLSKWAGGLGNDWTPVRGLGSYIKGTNGKSQGVVPFLKVVNDTAVAVNQGGKRKGAVCAYLETWHIDIEEFLELRKNTGDDRRRTHDMNSANWIPDLFMKRVFDDGNWTLFTPSETPDLHDLYGKAFEERYEQYEAMAANGEIKLHKTLKAQDLWRKMLGMLFETGHPWMTFKDPCNLRSPQQHVGVVHSSNLCTEITLNTNAKEIAVCNLGSINLAQHIDENGLNVAKLEKTVRTAVRMLDNVIDINYYSVPQARNSNLKHRPVGLGIMGFQDALYKMGYAYSSDQAVEFADKSMEAVSYFAISTSSDLAAERGKYKSYGGSLWDQGVFPIDSVSKLAEHRGEDYIDQDTSTSLDWAPLRKKVASQGMRNSNVMAIAPTATIANITGVSQSIEPTYQNLYVKSNLSGEFTVINPHLVRELKARDLWDPVMVNDLKYYEGSVQRIERIPADVKAVYATAFEVEPRWLVEAASRRQKWIDQAQSLNLYVAGANGKKLDITYRMAWFKGLKTTYYLRALAATTTEKSTIDTGSLNAVSAAPKAPVVEEAPAADIVAEAPAAPESVANDDDAFGQAADVPMACSLDDPDCEACQ